MAYKIIDIEGVGDVYAEKLIAAGIEKVDQLLDRCAAPKGRKELAEATGIPEKLILRWTSCLKLRVSTPSRNCATAFRPTCSPSSRRSMPRSNWCVVCPPSKRWRR